MCRDFQRSRVRWFASARRVAYLGSLRDRQKDRKEACLHSEAGKQSCVCSISITLAAPIAATVTARTSATMAIAMRSELSFDCVGWRQGSFRTLHVFVGSIALRRRSVPTLQGSRTTLLSAFKCSVCGMATICTRLIIVLATPHSNHQSRPSVPCSMGQAADDG